MTTLTTAARSRDSLETGDGLLFVIGAFRSGTTLLRKILDTHPAVHAPAETWYLLPLLNLWQGEGSASAYNPKQAAAAIRDHVDRAQFLDCCRAFAARFYRASVPADAAWIVDKTPPYLSIAAELPELFPDARFIVLRRDPRSILWSRATWKHTSNADPRHHMGGVAAEIRRLAEFRRLAAERAFMVGYERLCTEPDTACSELCAFLDIPFDAAMIEYGRSPHHEGYGDELSRDHDRPHTDGLQRWSGRDGLSADLQQELLDACGADALRELELDRLAIDASPPAPSRSRATSRAEDPSARTPRAESRPGEARQPTMPRLTERRRVMFFMHPGTISRDHFLDMADGFARTGCEVMHWELGPAWQRMAADQQRAPDYARWLTETLAPMLQSNHIDLTVGMWANGVESLAHGDAGGQQVSFFDLVQIPHLMFWLDAPHWAHGRSRHHLFNSPLMRSTWTFHLINNPATGMEMARLLGFGNVASMPYGVNERVFRPHEVQPQYDIVFGLGPGDGPPTPLMRRELDADEPDVQAIRTEAAERVRGRLEPFLDAFDAAARPGLRELFDAMIRRQLADRHTPMLDRLQLIAEADETLRAAGELLINRPDVYVNVTMAIRDIENWQRAFLITYLSRHFRCATFGTPTLDGWDCRAEHLGEVRHDEQSQLYATGRLGLNVMRWQDDMGANVKPFEIAASGVSCLMSRRSGVEACFVPDREIALFDTPAEARATAHRLLADEQGRADMASAALARVHADHTWTKRAGEIMKLIDDVTKPSK